MKRNTLSKLLLSMIAVGLLNLVTYAQSAAEIDMAKRYATSAGYSSSQIDQAVNGLNSSSTGRASSTTTTSAQVVDRNEGVASSMEGYKGLVEQEVIIDSNQIYGHNIFTQQNLNFTPNYNIPVPKDYRLAAGDEVIVDVWGDVMTNITATITPEGYISVPNMGLMYLAGQSVEAAENNVRQHLSKIYSNINNEPNNNQVKLSLGKTRSVTVNVVGDVSRPGSYTVPSLSTIAMVMYMSGGPDGIGSVRNINLYRNNKLISTFDVYDFLQNGNAGKNVRLEDNDIISVAPYNGVVSLEGGVKRPMRYEIVESEKLSDVLAYAGGFSHSAFSGSVVVERVGALSDKESGATAQSFIVNNADFDNFELMNGDIITVSENLDRFVNRASVSGAVWREGSYAIGEGENQASDLYELLELAGGLRDDAFLKRAYIERYGENRVLEQLTFTPSDVLAKNVVIELKPDDRVVIKTMDEVYATPTVNIAGEVNQPGTFIYRQNMTLGDLVIMAGGTTDGATLTNVEVARRILNTKDQDESEYVSEVVSLNYYDNPELANTLLRPYDMVFIRKSVNYRNQMTIEVNGEVKYPGVYVIENNTVRLSDLINKAGGLRKEAYVEGASLKRVVSSEGMKNVEISKDLVTDETDIIDVDLAIDDLSSVAINLKKAMDAPGSIADLVLKEGDRLTVPQLDNTVSVIGHVMKQNTLLYDSKKSLKDYISSAGGYKKRAQKRNIYVIQMNGSVAKVGSKDFVIAEGSTIVVPEKPAKADSSQTWSIATTTTTLLISILAILF